MTNEGDVVVVPNRGTPQDLLLTNDPPMLISMPTCFSVIHKRRPALPVAQPVYVETSAERYPTPPSTQGSVLPAFTAQAGSAMSTFPKVPRKHAESPCNAGANNSAAYPQKETCKLQATIRVANVQSGHSLILCSLMSFCKRSPTHPSG